MRPVFGAVCVSLAHVADAVTVSMPGQASSAFGFINDDRPQQAQAANSLDAATKRKIEDAKSAALARKAARIEAQQRQELTVDIFAEDAP